MINNNLLPKDSKIELPHYIKQDIVIDLLIKNLALNTALAKRMSYWDEESFQEEYKKERCDILAYVASKYGKA